MDLKLILVSICILSEGHEAPVLSVHGADKLCKDRNKLKFPFVFFFPSRYLVLGLFLYL